MVISGINYVDGKQLLLLMQLQSSSGEVDAYGRGRGRRMIKIEKLAGIDAKWRLCSARRSWH